MAKTFWSQAALEPKRQFRFLLELGPLESYVITKVNRPGFEVGETEHQFINHTFYYPGRVTWNEITFSLVDSVMPDTTGMLMKMLMASGYRFPNSEQTTRTISKTESVNALGYCSIKVLGAGDPDVALLGGAGNTAPTIEEWRLTNPWVKSVTMGDLDYGADDLISMDVTLRYDWATLRVMESGGNSTAQKLTPKSGAGTPGSQNAMSNMPPSMIEGSS